MAARGTLSAVGMWYSAKRLLAAEVDEAVVGPALDDPGRELGAVTWSSCRSTAVRSSFAFSVTARPGATFAKTARTPRARAAAPSFWLRESLERKRMSVSYSVAARVAIFLRPTSLP